MITETAKKEVIVALEDCLEYFSDREDADHDGEGFVPNTEMRMACKVREALELLGVRMH